MSLASPLDPHNGDYASLQKSSSSPEPQDGSQQAGRHRRNYQACDRCRGRKVKCDLGPVDAPHAPPCKRCMRERAACHFADQRKKNPDQKASEERDEDAGSHKRRRTNSGSAGSIPRYSSIGGTMFDSPHDRLANVDPMLQGMPAPTSVPTHRSPQTPGPGMGLAGGQLPHHINTQGSSRQDIKQEEIRSSGAETTFTPNQSRTTQDNLSTLWQAAQKIGEFNGDPQKEKDYERYAAGGPVALADEALTPEQQENRKKGLYIWRLARFVRAGWFTAEEALRYVEYFYTNLQPMTPVDVTEFRSPGRALKLLTEEPVLAVAILTISSRYMRLSGRSAETRAHKIHERLWASLMEQIQRLFWGQEQFGGGFTGAGVSRVRESASGQITWPGSLRTLGTIEALLLLSDWQPRSLHFPPDDDDNHLLNLNYDKLPGQAAVNGTSTTGHNPSLEALPFASWLEPAWRSDKMCWMLMGLAQALSLELGVFDPREADASSSIPLGEQQRKTRIRRMVLVYVGQISGRNGIPNPLRFSEWAPSDDYGSASPIDQMQGLWVHIASIMNMANRDIFPSRQFTRELTQGQGYQKSIASFAPLLESWGRHFEQVKGSLEEPMLSILLMEYEYARLYINSLGLQNVVEIWMRTDPKMQNSMSSVAKVVNENKRYIHDVTDASLHILEIVSNTLADNNLLRDAPVRVFLRCLSAMMFTLKRLSLGSHERLVQKSLNLLDRVCILLAREVVDDVHLCSQTSVLIQSIVKHIKKTLIRVQKPPNTSGVPSRDQSRAQTPHPNSHENGHVQGGPSTATLPTAPHTYATDHLANIPARPMSDLLDQTFIAPPNYNFQTNEFDFIDDSSLDHSMLSENPADWVTMPIDGLMNMGSGDANVDQGFHSIGPMIGSRDMLEVLTNQDYNAGLQDFSQMAWTSPTTEYQGFTSPHL